MAREGDTPQSEGLQRRPSIGLVRVVGEAGKATGSKVGVGLFYGPVLAAAGFPAEQRGGVLTSGQQDALLVEAAIRLPAGAGVTPWLAPLTETRWRECAPMLGMAVAVAEAGDIVDVAAQGVDLLKISIETFPDWKAVLAGVGTVVVFNRGLVLRIQRRLPAGIQ
jgi:hypothetical protein